jgi:putative membrane protein
MRNRLLSLTVAGVLMFGMCAFAQDASSSAGQSDTTAKTTKHKNTKKTSGADAMSGTQMGAAADQSSSKVPAADKAFVKKAAEGGMAEVQLGQLAADKASSNDVKDFGKMMVDDHSKANDQLKSVAQQKGITLPTDLSVKDKAEKDRLSKLSGEQFDRVYMQHMVKDHMKDVSEFKKESTMAKDDDIKNFAAQTLPTLQTHLDKAKSIAGTTGATSGKSGMGKKKPAATSSASTSQPPQ